MAKHDVISHAWTFKNGSLTDIGLDEPYTINLEAAQLEIDGVAQFGTAGAFNVIDYGAEGDGISDDTVAIQAAIDAAADAGGGIVFLPKGNYKVSSTLTITGTPVSIQGVGTADANLDAVGNLEDADYGSLITWAGGAAPVMSAVQVEGAHWHSFAIDGVGAATYGIQLDRVRMNHIHNIRIVNCATVSLRLFIGAVAGEHDNLMFNFFANLALERTPKALLLDGSDFGNCCHNQFSDLRIDHNAQYGIDLVEADNNTFTNVYTFSRAGGGVNDYGIRFGAKAYGNYVLRLHGRAYVVTPTIGTPPNVGGNVIFGYDRHNGNGAPTIEAGGRLDYTTTGSNSDGWHVEDLTVNETLTVTDHVHVGPNASFEGSIGLANAGAIISRNAANDGDIPLIVGGGDDRVYIRNVHSFGSTLAIINGTLIVDGDTIRETTQKTPASAAAAGTKGDIVHDANFIYVCTALDTWKRVAIATW